MTKAFGTLTRNQLKFKISVKPISPVHIGVGNEFLGRGAYHLYEVERQHHLALLSPRPLAERLLDQYGDQGNLMADVSRYMKEDKYPPAIARDIENGKLALRRMSVHPGALPYLRDTGRNGGLKAITALANGLPYIPGSSVKGALRTAWLDWQVIQPGAYPRFAAEARQANPRGRDRADDQMMERKQIAESMKGTTGRMQPQNRDLFRAVQVSDLIPDRSNNLTRVYAVLSMSYQSGDRGFARPSNGGQAGAQAWECLNPDAGATYIGTVTIDLDLLARLTSNDQDARNLATALAQKEQWQAALSGYGSRVYGTEKLHYEMLEDLPAQPQQGIKIWDDKKNLVSDWIHAEEQDNNAERLLPLGMGTGLLAHSLLGVLPPEDREDIAFLGDESSQGSTILKAVLDTGLKRQNSAYNDPEFPAPKSRRVTGNFDSRNPKDMRAERPLGWTAINLQEA